MIHPRFAALQTDLVVMTIAALFMYATSAFGYALTAAGAKADQLSVFGIALAVGLTTAFPFCAAYGISGAVVSTACSWTAAAILSGRLLRTVSGDSHGELADAGGTIRSRAV